MSHRRTCQEVWLLGEEREGGEKENEVRFRKEVGMEMELARSVRLVEAVERMSPIYHLTV